MTNGTETDIYLDCDGETGHALLHSTQTVVDTNVWNCYRMWEEKMQNNRRVHIMILAQFTAKVCRVFSLELWHARLRPEASEFYSVRFD